MTYWLYFIIASGLLFLAAGILVYLLKYGQALHIRYLILYLGSNLLWLFTQLLRLLSLKENVVLFWHNAGTVIGIFSVAFLFIFILAYMDNRLHPVVWWGMLAIAVVFSVICLSNANHHLFFSSFTFSTNDSFLILKPIYGPLYTAMVCVNAFILFFIIFKLFFHRSVSHQVFHAQLNFYAYATTLFIIYDLVCAMNVNLSFLPLRAVLALLPGLGFSLTAFRKNNMNLIPLPRSDMLEIMHDAFIVISSDGIIIDSNRELSSILGKEPKKFIGNPLLSIFPELSQRMEFYLQPDSKNGESPSQTDKLRFLFRYKEKHYDASMYAQPNIWIIILHDITPLIRSLDTTNQLARHDGLTGIHNRRSIESAIRNWLELQQNTNTPFCFVLFDIDHFKQFNDSYGHQAGDDVLRQITDLFQQSVRSTDLFGRFGGDEFILFLCDISEEQARKILDRGAWSIAHHEFRTDSGTTLSPTLSIGAIYFTATSTTPYEEIFAYADEALYYAKENGRNQICFRKRRQLDYSEATY